MVLVSNLSRSQGRQACIDSKEFCLVCSALKATDRLVLDCSRQHLMEYDLSSFEIVHSGVLKVVRAFCRSERRFVFPVSVSKCSLTLNWEISCRVV